MKPYKCIIIEDEPLAMERTKGYVEKAPSLALCATFDNSLEGLAYLQNHPVDILFLDISMDELSGMELLESSEINCQVIITTAYQQYALQGFELNVTDYLLKPFTFQRFLQAIGRAQQNLNKAQPEHRLEFFFLKTENRLEKVRIKDLLYIEGMRDYRRVHTVKKRIMTLQTFAELEQLLPPSLVCRVHKSYMVAIHGIESVERSRILIAGQRIPVSDTYRSVFLAAISGKA